MDPAWTALAFGLLIPVTAIVGGLVIAGLAIHHKSKLRELAYRERIAMIEKGIVPPPESDPARFEQTLSALSERMSDPALVSSRHRAAGVILVGAGIAVAVLLYFVTEEPRLAYGVGGAVIILGLAFLLNSLISYRDSGRPRSPAP